MRSAEQEDTGCATRQLDATIHVAEENCTSVVRLVAVDYVNQGLVRQLGVDASTSSVETGRGCITAHGFFVRAPASIAMIRDGISTEQAKDALIKRAKISTKAVGNDLTAFFVAQKKVYPRKEEFSDMVFESLWRAN